MCIRDRAGATADRRRPPAEPERAEGMSALLEAKKRAAVGRFGKSPDVVGGEWRVASTESVGMDAGHPPVPSAESASSDADGLPVAGGEGRVAQNQPPTTNDQLPNETLAARLRRRPNG